MTDRIDQGRIRNENMLYEKVMKNIADNCDLPENTITLNDLAIADVWNEMRMELTRIQKLVTKENDPGHIYDVLLAIIKALQVLAQKCGKIP